ncbi:helix-turn-helix domain-containing protein [Bacillus safensis]|uniref:helix-turn-helix domain-containing protein n=1 Tax=Bacillus safensis TaxID=561879 RepID=UPI002FFDCBD6
MKNEKRPIDFHDQRFVRVTKSVIADETYLDKPVQKLVYAVLCFYADNTSKKSHPSIQTIADKCRCSTNTVRKALRRLKELDLIDVKERKNANGQTSNEYTLWEPPEWFVETGTSKKDSSPLQDLK